MAGDVSSVGPSWDEVRREIFMPEEIQDSDRRVAEIGREIQAGLDKPAS